MGDTKKFVDFAVTLPQYLVSIGEPIPEIGLHRESWARRPTEDHLAREKFTEENTSWQPRKRLRRRKRNTNRRRDDTSQEPRIFTRSLSGEAPPEGLFDFRSNGGGRELALLTFCYRKREGDCNH